MPIVLLSLLIPVIALFQSLPATLPAPPKVDLSLHLNQTSVRPGGSAELAIRLRLPEGWHTYHPIKLDTGDAALIRFTTPPGLSFGPLRYPEPELGEIAGIRYLAHHGELVILTTLHVDKDVPLGSLPVKADLSLMVCKELCVPLDKSALLMITIADDEPQPANAKLFEDAQSLIPAALGKSEYLEGSAIKVERTQMGPADDNAIVLTIKVRKAHHIQDIDSGNENLIPTRLFVESFDGLKFDPPQWPKPHSRDVPGYGDVREQTGTFQIRIPFRIIDAKFPSGEVALRVLLTYQTCTDDGTCFAPLAAEDVVRFTVDSTNAPAPHPPQGTLYARVVHADADTIIASMSADEAESATHRGANEQPEPFVLILLASFIGGLILNIMPCVLPVISLKVLSFIQQGGEDRSRVLRLGLAFSLGIMAWFWLFAFISRAGQLPLQEPLVVLGLASLMFVLALNLFGVFEIVLPGAAATTLTVAASREGYTGAFMKGLLATLLGTACTAPFLAGALTYAFTQPWHVAFSVFTAAGVGMAAPYLLLCANPAWLKHIPKPGAWMVTFKQAMGFIIAGTAVWLLWILGRQMGADGVTWAVAFWGFLALAAWLLGKSTPAWSTIARIRVWTIALLIAFCGYYFCFEIMYVPPAEHGPLMQRVDAAAIARDVQQRGYEGQLPWVEYTPGIEMAQQLAAAGHTVWLDYTAAWCVNCQVNKRVALETTQTRATMKDLRVIPLEANFTNPSKPMKTEINRYANSVPVNLVFPANKPNEPIVLPILFTESIAIDRLREAGPSNPPRSESAPATNPRAGESPTDTQLATESASGE